MNWNPRLWCLLAVSFMGAMAIGCGGGGVSGTVPVSGKVSYKGQPVAGAIVTFTGGGEGSRPAVAVSEADGTYKLKTLESDGALPGKYKVTVIKTETTAESAPVSMEDAAKQSGKAAAAAKELLPPKYANGAETPLQFEVKSGVANTFDLPLED
jgi:hypothetical protein